MKKHNKIILTAAAIAVAGGAAICAAAISAGGAKTAPLEEKTKTVSEKITALIIAGEYDDITIVPRDTDSVTVRYTEGGTKKYDITSENGTLLVYAPELGGKQKWYERISLDFLDRDNDRARKTVIEVPRGFEADISVEANYGDVEISGVGGRLSVKLDCGDAEINGCDLSALECIADYGDIEIKNTTAENIKLDNDRGDIELEEVTGNIDACCDLGDIEFENISGDNLIFKNSRGDIEGTVRGNEADYASGADKRLEADTDLGKTNIRFVK